MHKFWLTIIITIGIFFRFYHLTQSPPALNWDEVSIGYNAYSILKTGKDEWGQFLPLSFKAFGEHKLPGMIYASIPGIAIFGTTDIGVRITPAVIGILSIIVIYLLSKKLFNSQSLGLFSALLLAISPWGIHFSRVSFESGLAMLFLISSIYFLIDAKTSRQNLYLAMIFAVLSAYTYNSIRILLPLLFLAYLANRTISIDRNNLKKLILPVIIGFALITPIIISLANPEGRVRLGTVNITTQKSFTDNIAESRGYTTLPSILPRLIHNKATHYAYELFNNYLHIFSTDFLFFKGGENTQRSVQGMGLLYLFELPLLIVGLIQLFKKTTPKHIGKILLPWLLLAPVPSIITIDSPSTVRALNLLPALILLESMGMAIILNWLKTKKLGAILTSLFVVWNICYFSYLLFYVYPVKFSDKWQYGYKQAVQYGESHYDDADLIYLPAKYGEPYIFTLFYTGFDPAKYHSLQVKNETDPTGWVHNSGFDKYRFSDYSGLETPEEIVARNHGKIVLITGFAQLPAAYERTFEVKAPNWKVMFEGSIQEGKQ